MKKKKYTSYAEIDSELEILKLEKEISFQKIVLSLEKTKESLMPRKIINGFVSSYAGYFSNSSVKILQTILPYIIGWFINKKRGN